jgi:outer membrane receptor protein involved in Fe transport
MDQGDVEFPGMVFDINNLKTDAFELKYVVRDKPYFDLLTVEGWYNRTAFTGDTSRPGKNRQIPSLRDNFDMDDDQFLVTDVDGMSAGYRAAMTWGDRGCEQLTVGTDLIRLGTQLNDIVPEVEGDFGDLGTATVPSTNYPIPRSHSIDFGVFLEHVKPVTKRLTVRTGARADVIWTDARESVPGMGNFVVTGFPPLTLGLQEKPLSELKQAPVEQEFFPWSLFATLDYQLNSCWTLTGGAGYAMRPPNLTEMYAYGPFIGSLQPGLTYVEGDPLLDPERVLQVDLGAQVDYGAFRMGFSAFHAWAFDYITYDDIGENYLPPDVRPEFIPGESLQHVAYTNTDLATLTGFELLAEQDVNRWLTGFAVVSYVHGTDHSRSTPARIAQIIRDDPDIPRSKVEGVDTEPLPGIPPLEARLGVRLHQGCPNPAWGVELEARVVDNQNRVAATLFEAPTPGFTIWNLRGYWQARKNLMLIGGVENITDKFYREHLDYRPGRSVWREGINFYAVTELTY